MVSMFKRRHFNKKEKLKMKMENFLTFVLFQKLPKIVKKGTKQELLNIYREYYPVAISKESSPSQAMMAKIVAYTIEEELYKRRIISGEITAEASMYATISAIQEKAKHEVE